MTTQHRLLSQCVGSVIPTSSARAAPPPAACSGWSSAWPFVRRRASPRWRASLGGVRAPRGRRHRRRLAACRRPRARRAAVVARARDGPTLGRHANFGKPKAAHVPRQGKAATMKRPGRRAWSLCDGLRVRGVGGARGPCGRAAGWSGAFARGRSPLGHVFVSLDETQLQIVTARSAAPVDLA